MERRMQLMEAADEMERGLFVIRCLRLEEKYQKKACRKEAVEAFEELFRLGVEQEKGHPGWELAVCIPVWKPEAMRFY